MARAPEAKDCYEALRQNGREKDLLIAKFFAILQRYLQNKTMLQKYYLFTNNPCTSKSCYAIQNVLLVRNFASILYQRRAVAYICLYLRN